MFNDIVQRRIPFEVIIVQSYGIPESVNEQCGSWAY